MSLPLPLDLDPCVSNAATYVQKIVIYDKNNKKIKYNVYNLSLIYYFCQTKYIYI